MKTVAAYIRVSTDDQTEYSPDSQLEEIKDYAKRHDMIIGKIYIDAGISGRNAKKRPEFQNMIAAAKSKPAPFEAILVWKYSRFARNQEESILYKSLLRKECNVDVISITEETGNSMFGSLIERIIEWMDEFYSVRLSEEVRTKMTYVAERGGIQTIAPFGYRREKDGPMLIDEAEAEWIQFIFSQFLAGKSMLGIARVLNDNGVRTHRGTRFENRTIEYILNNPMYAGYVRWTPSGKTVSKRIYDSEETITAKGDFESIISDEMFNAALEELKRRKKARKKYDKPADVKKHWLSGIIKCSSCGSTLAYSPAHGGFQCYKYAKGTCKVSHFVKAEKLEDAIINAIEQVTITNEFIKDNTRINDVKTIDYAPQISRLEKMLQRAKNTYLEGIDTLEEYSYNKMKIIAEIEDLKAKDAEQKRSVEYAPIDEVQQKFDSVAQLLHSDEPLQVKNQSVSSIVEKAVFSKSPESLKVFFYL